MFSPCDHFTLCTSECAWVFVQSFIFLLVWPVCVQCVVGSGPCCIFWNVQKIKHAKGFRLGRWDISDCVFWGDDWIRHVFLLRRHQADAESESTHLIKCLFQIDQDQHCCADFKSLHVFAYIAEWVVPLAHSSRCHGLTWFLWRDVRKWIIQSETRFLNNWTQAGF